MKKIIITIVLGLSILTLISSTIKITQAYQSEPTIYYNGKNKEIVYFNVKDKDLFPNLKDLMPGDKKEQEITIYYIEYKGEKFFLHENLREYDLPEITEDTVDLALRVNALTRISPRYVTLVDDVIKHPNAYVKKMKKYLKNKTDLLRLFIE